jgi:hypothetical protein
MNTMQTREACDPLFHTQTNLVRWSGMLGQTLAWFLTEMYHPVFKVERPRTQTDYIPSPQSPHTHSHRRNSEQMALSPSSYHCDHGPQLSLMPIKVGELSATRISHASVPRQGATE